MICEFRHVASVSVEEMTYLVVSLKNGAPGSSSTVRVDHAGSNISYVVRPSRMPRQRSVIAPIALFQPDFARSIRRADRLQPALLIATIVSTAGLAVTTSETTRTLAFIAAGGYALTLASSGALLVPPQRRLIAGAAGEQATLRRRWYRGHLTRTAGGLASFALTAVAVATAR
jgi:hypothetical protein